MKSRPDFRRAVEGGGVGSGERLLDPVNPWDGLVLEEAADLRKWTGINARLAHSTNGTAARDDDTVLVDREQLHRLFGHFTGEKYKTGIFMALAHEFGHLCQFKYWGHAAFDMDSLHAEAHADYLAGVWLGWRLSQGQERLTEDVFEAGIQLKARSANYPTAYQRGRLVQDAMGSAVMLLTIVEPQIPADPDYGSVGAALTESDVRQLFDIAISRLEELPEDDSWKRLLERGPFAGPFRRR